MHDRNRPKYVILGAGISGLSLAYFLKKNLPNCHITIVEKKSVLGGWIQTKNKRDFLFEAGPHTLRLSDPFKTDCFELFADLGLSSEIIHATKVQKKRLTAYDNQVHPIGLKQLLMKKQTLMLLMRLFKRAQTSPNDETVEDFFNKQIGKELTKQLIDPLVTGIQGGDISKLSASACFPSLFANCQKPQSLLSTLLKLKKKAELISFKQGLSQLIDALAQPFKNSIHLNTTVTQLQFSPNLTVTTDHQKIEANHIFSTLPANDLAYLLPNLSEPSFNFLKEQKRVSFKMVHIGYDRNLNVPDAFGYISPSWSNQNITGVLFDSKIFPDHNKTKTQTRLSAMIHERSPLFGLTGKDFEEALFKELQALLKIYETPSYLHVELLKNAIPQYNLGHEKKLEFFKDEIQNKFPHFSFCGNSFYGLSVPSCIFQAKQLAQSFCSRSQTEVI